jgi:hypothetical protein
MSCALVVQHANGAIELIGPFIDGEDVKRFINTHFDHMVSERSKDFSFVPPGICIVALHDRWKYELPAGELPEGDEAPFLYPEAEEIH